MAERCRKFRGLTLIELVVVLMVLVALAGIMIPQLTGFVDRSHGATGATNLGAVRASIELYNVKYLKGYPDYLDSLLVTGTGAKFSKLNSDLSGRISILTLDAVQAQSLIDAGITQLGDHVAAIPAGGSATDSVTGAARTMAETEKVAQLNAADATAQLFANAADLLLYDYVVFGVGRNCTAVGNVMAEPPLDFEVDPATEYSRCLLVFGVPKTGTAAANGFKAVFKGVLGREGEGIADHLNTYHKAK